MLNDSLIFMAGITALTFGANMLVTHSSRIATHFNIKPFIIGITIIAFGTSAPELVVSLSAAIKGTNSIALGNIIGSNIANIGFILGASALMSPMLVEASVLKREVMIMIGATLLLYLLSLDGIISRLDGIILFTGIVAFTYYCIKNGSSSTSDDDLDKKAVDDKIVFSSTMLIVGLTLLIIGAHYMVQSAVSIAESFGVSKMFIGLTMVAIGTSLPEFAATTAAIIQKKGDMGIGNVVGSNIFNILLVLGAVSIVNPIPVDVDLLYLEYPMMVVFSLLLFLFGYTEKKYSRREGAFLILCYCAFILFLYYK